MMNAAVPRTALESSFEVGPARVAPLSSPPCSPGRLLYRDGSKRGGTLPTTFAKKRLFFRRAEGALPRAHDTGVRPARIRRQTPAGGINSPVERLAHATRREALDVAVHRRTPSFHPRPLSVRLARTAQFVRLPTWATRPALARREVFYRVHEKRPRRIHVPVEREVARLRVTPPDDA